MADTSKFFLAYCYESKEELNSIIGLTDEIRKNCEWLVYQNGENKEIILLHTPETELKAEGFYIVNEFDDKEPKLGILGICLNACFTSPEDAILFALNNNIKQNFKRS